ncbi:hypothetical protein IAG25_32515 [Caballeronia sp. EK]|uniref:hypothetical protein n=1 Tax=Caballeronia sp. EK TaxID=2767469 RepID=UPI0016560692|nr:hypothetical protein [Caballeronia sp. EK]MBC8641548.1 hypothetical protein [Caballeronia sp. EK]
MKTDNNRSIGRKTLRYVALNAIPFYPLYAALRSMRQTAGAGAATLRDLNDEIAADSTRPHVVTFRQALERRPEGALSFAEIRHQSIRSKRVAFVFTFFGSCFGLGSLIGGNFLGFLLSLLLIAFTLLTAVKHSHRIWQIEAGCIEPDRPLGSVRDFLRSPGAIATVFDLCVTSSI